jgi:hypothetical protein
VNIKPPDFSDIGPAARSLILISVAAAFGAWDIGFELGAFGRIFFEKLFMVWSISTALLIALIVVPRDRSRVPFVALFVTAFPSFWLLLALLVRASPDSPDLRLALFLSGLVVYLACFPYAIYMGLSLAYPDLLKNTQRRPKIALLLVVVTLFAAGYLMGANHHRLVTCEDFAISGQYVPENCQPEQGRERLFH